MKTHERFLAAARGLPLDRLPVIEWAMWWGETVSRWRTEQPAIRDRQGIELQRHFGLDVQLQNWFPTISAAAPKPAAHGAPIVSDLAEYEKIRPLLFPEPRLDADFLKLARQLRADGDGVAWYTLEGFFWFPRQLLGIENHLYSFYDAPELYHTICRDLLAWQQRAVTLCAEQFPFTFMTFAEDMSYNNGPMISRATFDEFIAPYYREIIPLINQTGTLTMVDSDGDITQATGWFGDCGVNGMLPLERQAGVEVSRYLDAQPQMFFLGHFDKMVMHQGRAALEREFARLLPSARRGRFIPSVDHQTPPAVSYEDYRQYVSLLKQFAVEAVR
ncbi:MAG: hypothetical protein LBK76_00410 [Verrucomicrobiales bacterium]|jgi:hypothetical protein|nr:hypothetical protein [Verrucomicrobiales bacterium]